MIAEKESPGFIRGENVNQIFKPVNVLDTILIV